MLQALCITFSVVISDEEASDGDVDLSELSLQNRVCLPFRDMTLNVPSESTSDDGDGMSHQSSTIDSEKIKRKVKSQRQREDKRNLARRLRKIGESAVVTKARRQNMADVKHRDGWDY